ncbi:hypothetical protein JVU11DRAFT_4852 [Chiua virens]|nr:hypothetical protein JVU11DRAFT_4852 [Chiua virens]
MITSPIDPPNSYVPYVRRRNTPAQLDALHKLFQATPHPTRAQRQALANEIGMELKSVTNWFQNKRQTSRRKSLSFKENDPTKTRSPSRPTRHQHRRSKTPLDRSKISLDRIAALSERPSLTSPLDAPPRVPLTPRKGNVQKKGSASPSQLWTHMLSSPAVPPSSPDREEAHLTVLSSRTKTLCPLEWACLKARQEKWVDEEADGVFTPPVLGNHRVNEDGAVLEGSIDLEDDANVSLHTEGSSLDRRSFLFFRPRLTPQFEDVEAAITLLGFKMRSQSSSFSSR